MDILAKATKADHTNSVEGPRVSTRVRATLVEAWRHAAGDPDVEVVQWLLKGAPAGIEAMASAAGILPECGTNDMLPIGAVATDELTLTNYQGVEEHEATQSEH